MGIFFRQRSAVQPGPSLRAEKATQPGGIIWGRVIAALVITALLGAATVFSGLKPQLSELYKVLLHAVELYLGGLLGLISGEAISRT